MALRNWMVLVGVLAASVAATAVGCSSEPGATAASSAGPSGSVSFALSATGPDGATYSLPYSYSIDFVSTGDGGYFNAATYFSTATGNESFTLPANAYNATLTGGPTDGAAGWTLNRAGDGGATTVNAILLDAQPYVFNIAAGATTPLTMHFEVAAVGVLTFSTGTLQTALSVDSGTVAPGHAAFSATGGFTSSGYTAQGPSVPTLNTMLAIPSGATESVPVSIALTLTSPFLPGIDSVCAPISATVTATATPDGGVQDNYAAWLQELNNAAGSLCFYDSSSPYIPNGVTLELYRSGATTPQFQFLNADAGAPEFLLWTYATPATSYYSNGILSLGAFNQPLALTMSTFQSVIETAGGSFIGNWGTATSATLQISP